MTYAAHILLLISLAYMVLLGYAWSRPRTTTTRYFMLMLVCSMIWAITYYLELILPARDVKVALRLGRFLFLAWVPMLWLLMTCGLFNLGAWIPLAFWRTFAALNMVTMLMAVTAPFHHLFLFDMQIQAIGSVGILNFSQGPWYCFYLLYNQLLALFAFGLLLVAWPRSRGVRRQNLTLLILGLFVPLLISIGYSFGKTPVANINLAPFSLAFSISILAWVVLRNRALDIVPLARGILLDHLPDLVLVTDARGWIVDMNQACEHAVGRTLSVCAKQPADTLPVPWRESLDETSGMLKADIRGQPHWYEVNRLDITADGGNERVGRLHVWRDMTLRHQAELDRMELERVRADARIVEQQKCLLRDMHDGLGGIAINISLLANLGLQETETAAKDDALEKIETLAIDGNAEIRSLMNAMEHRELVWSDWLLDVRNSGQASCAGRLMEFESTVEGPVPETPLSLLAGMSMFRMIKEAITNAVKHAGASRLELRLRFSEQGFEAVVQDNGQGFDPAAVRLGHGLANLRKRAAELGGEMSLSGGNGTRCRFLIPIPINYPDETLELTAHFLQECRQ
ncbi:MAG: histidine kinase N-terminal 7TM domain-containing protein [bacterium]